MEKHKSNTNDSDADNLDDPADHSLPSCVASSSLIDFEQRLKGLETRSILSILRKTSTGRCILKEYETRGNLSDKSSKYLSNLIIDHFLLDSKT